MSKGLYPEIEQLAANPETAKDALILWLSLRLAEAHRAMSAIAAVTAAYERKTSGVARKVRRSTNGSSRA